MKTITNEKVLLALGWKWEETGDLFEYHDSKDKKTRYRSFLCRHYGVYRKGEEHFHKHLIPAYTTDVNVILAEIQKTGYLVIYLCQVRDGKWSAQIGQYRYYGYYVVGESSKSKTAALALCEALLAFLKNSPVAKFQLEKQ